MIAENKRRRAKKTMLRLFLTASATLMLIVIFAEGTETTAEAAVLLIPAGQSVKLDGSLSEPFWEQAAFLGPLTMVEPKEGAPASERTDIKVLATAEAVYIGVICFDREPSRIVSSTMQRDSQLRGDDHIKIVLDTFLNGRTGYVFGVNPDGARYDALIEKEGQSENHQWDGIWEASVRRTAEGWSAEICIPVKTLRFRTGLDSWGFNVERRIERLQEVDRWASANRNFKITHVSRAGRITALPEFRQGNGLTVRPYATGARTQDDPGLPALEKLDAGLDILKNFGGNITGLLSVNTDFAETEVDTRQVNLTRFPLFFPEKRTFFLEGSDIFEFGLGMGRHRETDIVPFFSRRVGLTSGYAVPINIALKATGSVGRFNFGVLDTLMESVDGVSPRANLFAARGFQNIFSESKVGFLLTGGDPLGREGGWTAGVDFLYNTSRFQGDKNFLVGAWALMSQHRDLGRDRSAWGFKVDYPNDLWEISLTFKKIGEDFDPALGFVPWSGIYKANFDLIYKPRPGWPWLRQMFNEFFTMLVTDLDGRTLKWRIFTAPVNWQLESGDRVEFNYVPQMEFLAAPFFLTKDVSVPAGKHHWTRYRLEFFSADKRKLKTELTWWFGSWYNGRMDQLQAEVGLNPSRRWNVSLEGERNLGRLPSGKADI